VGSSKIKISGSFNKAEAIVAVFIPNEKNWTFSFLQTYKF
jgi:hypothetical protein